MHTTAKPKGNFVHAKKLVGTKWTAVEPRAREKHFLVVSVVEPVTPDAPTEFVDLEAVYSGRVQRLRWIDLRDSVHWRQGWL
jgi:tryptophan-rich hypothetical protein